MKVKVEHVAMLHCDRLAADGMVELSEPATILDLLNALGIRPDHQNVVVPFINSERAKRTSSLSDGDAVFLTLALGGG